MAYDVFISYSRKDTEIVNRIEAELKKYDVTCFIDRSGIDLGSDFAEIIAKSIYESEIMIFIWSENSNQSENTANEIALAIEFEKIIIPFKIGTFKAHYKLAYRLVRFNRIDAITFNEPQILELAEKTSKQLNKTAKNGNSVSVDDTMKPMQTTPAVIDNGDNSLFEMSYQSGKQALLKFDINYAFEDLLEPALNDYKDSRVLLARILRGKTRIIKVDTAKFDYALEKADEGNPYAQYIMSRYYNRLEKDNKKAFEYAEKSAEQNSPYGLGALAKIYYLGIGTQKDNKKYLKYSREAISMNDCGAIYDMALNYLYGWSVNKNKNMAISLINKGIELDDPLCYDELGQIYWQGEFIEQNTRKAEELIQKSIDMGCIEGYESLGRLYGYEPVTFQIKDERKGFEYNMKGAEYSEANCMCQIATYYHYGGLMKQDIKIAIKWYKKAADAGNSLACYLIGCIYYYSEENIPFDPKLAWRWFQRGAASLCNSCLYMLGVMCINDYAQEGKTQMDAIGYFEKAEFLGGTSGELSMLMLYKIYNGEGKLSELIAKDEDLAMKWLNKAADENNAEACFIYGKILSDMSSPYSNELKAVKYLQYAANSNNYEAALFLGKLYIHNRIIMKDWDKAKEMLSLAAEKGDLAEAYCELGKLYSHANQSEWEHNEYDENDDDNKIDNGGLTKEQKDADNRRAKEYFEKAAAKEYAEAYVRLAELEFENFDYDNLSDGDSGKKYFELICKAANLDYPQAILDMGVCYQIGIGTAADIYKAIEWYKKAAANNNKFALNILGGLYNDSEDDYEGVTKDNLLSYYWYERALKAGNNEANKHLESLKTEFKSKATEIEESLDKAHIDQFIKYTYLPVPDEYWEETDAVLKKVYSPCIELAKNREILDTTPDNKKDDVVYLNKNYQDLLNSWNDVCRACSCLLKYTPTPLVAGEIYPYCSDKLIFHLRCQLASIWLDLKPKYSKLSSIQFYDDYKILNLAEIESNDMLQLMFIAMAECSIILDVIETDSNIVFNLYMNINKPKNEEREESILELAEMFFNGEDVNRSYAVAKHLYSQIPNNCTAKNRLSMLG